jgi:hypothetical protein
MDAQNTIGKNNWNDYNFTVCKTNNDTIKNCPLNDRDASMNASVVAVHNPSGQAHQGLFTMRSAQNITGV